MESKLVKVYDTTPTQLVDQIFERFDQKLEELKIKNQSKEQEELLTVEETLGLLKCSKQALWNWRKKGILIPYRLGCRVYYLRSDIFKKLVKQI